MRNNKRCRTENDRNASKFTILRRQDEPIILRIDSFLLILAFQTLSVLMIIFARIATK